MSDKLVRHRGSCHCGAVKFTVDAPASVRVYVCNCTICDMKKNHHFIVPEAHFILESGQDKLTEYRFGTGTARHLFCSVCGVQSFYRPRSNPDGVAVTLACVQPGTIEHVDYAHYDGRNWERAFASSDITQRSKL